MKKKIGAAVVIATLAAGALWWIRQPAQQGGDLLLYGNVDLRQVALAFNSAERITEVLVEEGQSVKAGQVMARLDTRTAQLRLTQAKAQLDVHAQALHRLQAGSRPEELAQAKAHAAAVQADAELARQQQERLQATARSTGGRAVSQQDLESAQARSKATSAQLNAAQQAVQLAEKGPRKEDIAQAQAQYDAAKAALAVLEQQLLDASLAAPVAAVVRARLMEPGEMASPQRPVITLALADPKWVRTYVKEADLGRIKPGMSAAISIDSLPNQPIAGKVGSISAVAEFTPKTVQTEELRTSLVYEVRVLADDKADRLRMGMPATVRIATGRNGH